VSAWRGRRERWHPNLVIGYGGMRCGSSKAVVGGYRWESVGRGVGRRHRQRPVEAPYEVAIIDVRVARAEVRVRGRVHVLGPPAVQRDPVLAPADETCTFGAGGWRLAPRAAECAS
jgi:hypothetical protein